MSPVRDDRDANTPVVQVRITERIERAGNPAQVSSGLQEEKRIAYGRDLSRGRDRPKDVLRPRQKDA